MKLRALRERASDIHVEPQERSIRVRYRCDGVLGEAQQPPAQLRASIVSRLKIMAGLDIAERRIPQDGKFQLRVEGIGFEMRVYIKQVYSGLKFRSGASPILCDKRPRVRIRVNFRL